MGTTPIFEIFLMENGDKELVYKNGVHSGFPDMGATSNMGYYYNLNDAVEAMNRNACDIREHFYNAGFVLCRFPGLYADVPKAGRIYFEWDDEKEGFFEKPEPIWYQHITL